VIGTDEQEALLVRYLLGLSTEEERTQVEEQYFSKSEHFDHLLAVEDSLIDDYLSGRLPAAQRDAFKESFSSRGEDVRFSRVLIERITQKKVKPPERVSSRQSNISRSWMPLLRSRTYAFAASIFLALLIAIVGLLAVNRRLRNTLAKSEGRYIEMAARNSAAQKEKEERQLLTDSLENELKVERNRLIEAENAFNAATGAVHPASSGYTPVLLATQFIARGSTGMFKEVTVPQSGRGLQISIPLKEYTHFDFYRVSLRAPGTREAMIDKRLLRPTGNKLTVQIKRDELRPGEFTVSLQGEQTAKPSSDLQEFRLRIFMK